MKHCVDCHQPTRFGADRCVLCSAARGGFFVRNPKHQTESKYGENAPKYSPTIELPPVSRDIFPRST